jgi:hypothetical protein
VNSALTDSERRCLGNILAAGGSSDLTQGRVRLGSLRKSTVRRLVRRGLVCAEVLAQAYQVGGSWYPETRYYATAAGCVAFGEIAILS